MYRPQALILSFFAILLFSCSKESPSPGDRQQTMLIYMAGENSMSSVASLNISQILDGLPRSIDANEIIIYLDKRDTPPSLLRVNGKTRRTETVKEYPETDSATKEALRAAVRDAFSMYPARKYSLVLWSHGSGWIPSDNTAYYRARAARASAPTEIADLSDIMRRTRWFGTEGNSHIDISDIAEVLGTSAPHLSFILFDACLMGSVEVAYELRNCTDHIIAAPTEVLMAGFPYDRVMTHIFDTPDLGRVCREFYDYYLEIKPSATISLIKSSELEPLATKTREILSSNHEAMGAIDPDTVQSYDRKPPLSAHLAFDLRHIIEGIASPEQYAEFCTLLDRAVPCRYATERFYVASYSDGFDIDPEKYSGLSVYLPSATQHSDLNAPHQATAWSQATGWSDGF